jgi:hypothetical protein
MNFNFLRSASTKINSTTHDENAKPTTNDEDIDRTSKN